MVGRGVDDIEATFAHADSGGAARLHFTGRVKARPLASGGYRLLLAPRSAAGISGRAVAVAFRIVP